MDHEQALTRTDVDRIAKRALQLMKREDFGIDRLVRRAAAGRHLDANGRAIIEARVRELKRNLLDTVRNGIGHRQSDTAFEAGLRRSLAHNGITDPALCPGLVAEIRAHCLGQQNLAAPVATPA